MLTWSIRLVVEIVRRLVCRLLVPSQPEGRSALYEPFLAAESLRCSYRMFRRRSDDRRTLPPIDCSHGATYEGLWDDDLGQARPRMIETRVSNVGNDISDNTEHVDGSTERRSHPHAFPRAQLIGGRLLTRFLITAHGPSADVWRW